MGVEFKPLAKDESNRLTEALRKNAEDGTPLHLDALTTGWMPGSDEVTDDEVIASIASVPCHYADRAVGLAVEMLRGNETYIADAREGAPVGNSVAGSLLSSMHGIPRQYGEPAVLEALAILDKEAEHAVAEPRQDGERFTLLRTGNAPLRFMGERLHESEGHIVNGRDHNRWHDLAVYRTTGGKYVVSIRYRTQWQGELDRDHAAIVDKPEQVTNALRDYDPCGPVAGYPTGDAYADRQVRLMDDVRRRYEAQVSELLDAAPEFAEEIA